jgi:hypothetical protein
MSNTAKAPLSACLATTAFSVEAASGVQYFSSCVESALVDPNSRVMVYFPTEKCYGQTVAGYQRRNIDP